MRQQMEIYLKNHGAGVTPHSGRTLWDHLDGVRGLLERAGAPDYLCHAGLFHSVYGTLSFKKVSVPLSKRNEVAALIGEKSERLVWLFSTLPRPEFLERCATEDRNCLPEELRAVGGSDHDLEDLLWLECANLIDQRALHQFRALGRFAQEIGMLDSDGFAN